MNINIVSGVTGQDGSYMFEDLSLEKNNIVFGLARSLNSSRDLGCLNHKTYEGDFVVFSGSVQELINKYEEGSRAFVLNCDISSRSSVRSAFELIQKFLINFYPQVDRLYCYHFAALSHVKESYDDPSLYINTNTLGSVYLFETFLDLLRNFNRSKGFFYHAATTELFEGDPDTVPQTSKTEFKPRSPYAVSKLSAYYMLQFLLNNSDIKNRAYLRQGILSNHESPRRPLKFVTAKIVDAVVRFYRHGQKTPIGNLEAKRDWGYAKDYMKAIQLMMTEYAPHTITIGTGIQHTVKDFAMKTIMEVSKQTTFVPVPLEDIFYLDQNFIRSNEVHSLCIDPKEAEDGIGWVAPTQLDELITIMVKERLNEPA